MALKQVATKFPSMRFTSLIFFCYLGLTACISSKKNRSAADLETLQDYMTGAFNSSAQAARDTDYYDITLHMQPIWENREGHWLYVEQAVTKTLEKPYRQRIYKLEKVNASTFRSMVFTIKNEKSFIHLWEKPETFNALSFNDIELKSGCEVTLKKQPDGSFSGATGERTCPSELRGASYATSKVTISPDKIVSWDQGFDKDGKQVWGAVKAGYEFLKQKK